MNENRELSQGAQQGLSVFSEETIKNNEKYEQENIFFQRSEIEHNQLMDKLFDEVQGEIARKNVTVPSPEEVNAIRMNMMLDETADAIKQAKMTQTPEQLAKFAPLIEKTMPTTASLDKVENLLNQAVKELQNFKQVVQSR